MSSSKLLNGDAYELFSEIPDASIDLILTDPPYAITNAKWDNSVNWPVFWKEVKRVRKPNAVTAIFGTGKFLAELGASNVEEFRYPIIWEKNISSGFLQAKKAPLRIHEQIYIFYSKRPVYNPQMRYGFKSWAKSKRRTEDIHDKDNRIYTGYGNIDKKGVEGARYPIDIIKFPIVQRKKGIEEHPTAKPVKLLEWIIKTYTDEGMTVLDPFMGGGSCGVACRNTNRNFIGFEKEPKWFEHARVRVHTPSLLEVSDGERSYSS